jgi:RHS repeat-associated protein
MTSQQRFLPFGGLRTDVASPNAPNTDLSYTGQRDLGMGLMDYKARFYDSYLKRWDQPDSIVPNLYNPQSLNRYAYVLNNPTRYNDPTGHSVECGLGDVHCRAGRLPLQDSILILACGKETNGGCAKGEKVYSDIEGMPRVPMDKLASYFSEMGGQVIYLDHSAYGNTDAYAQAIYNIIHNTPKVTFYMVGHSAGANAIIGALSYYQSTQNKQGEDLAHIKGVALLDGLGTAPQQFRRTKLTLLTLQILEIRLMRTCLLPKGFQCG